MVVIVDYQLGNLFSVRQALMNIGLSVTVSNDAKDIANADAVVLPGVGAFKDAMNNLDGFDLVKPLVDYVQTGKPFLGICLGLQLLFSESEEFGSNKGLNIIQGTVKRFSNFNSLGQTVKVPQIAWNNIEQTKDWKDTPLENTSAGSYMYFVHSFYVQPDDDNLSLSKTQYHNTHYTSSIFRQNVFACQFHPEKSGKEGLMIYKKWAQLNKLNPELIKI
jgi:imidazole glycerol-phosphate synthase subunit HisH